MGAGERLLNVFAVVVGLGSVAFFSLKHEWDLRQQVKTDVAIHPFCHSAFVTTDKMSRCGFVEILNTPADHVKFQFNPAGGLEVVIPYSAHFYPVSPRTALPPGHWIVKATGEETITDRVEEPFPSFLCSLIRF